MILVSSPTVDTHHGRVRHQVKVDGTPEPMLYFDGPQEFAHMVSTTLDHFALALLLPAMRSGQDLHLDGPLTDELLFNLNGPVQAWIRSILPVYQQVRVSADRVQTPGSPPSAVATGFSAGVDSFSVLGDYFFNADVPKTLRVTHLLFNNVGSRDAPHMRRAALELANVRSLSSGWGIPVVDVTSNLDDHLVPLGTHTAFHNTHTVRNASVAHFLGAGVGAWLYASAVHFKDVHGRESDMATSDPLSLPLLSTASLRLKAVGHERTRVQKTFQVAQLESARAGLTVCIDTDWNSLQNCSKCSKCMRTLLTLDIGGELSAFCPQRFDLQVYRAHRDAFMVEVLASARPLYREIVEFAADRGFVWPDGVRQRARLYRATEQGKRMAGLARRRVREVTRRAPS